MIDTLNNMIDKFYTNTIYCNRNKLAIVTGNFNPSYDSLLFNTNDYLGLDKLYYYLSNPKLNKLNKLNLLQSGVFSSSNSIKDKLEDRISNFTNYESSLLYQSGYCANLDLLQVISYNKCNIYIDINAHASIHNGAKNTNGKIILFRHNNYVDLENKINKYGSGIILVDSIYSVNGDMCDLKKVSSISKSSDSILVVDESHSLGLYGKNGEGLVNELNLQDKVDIITASLSKAFATRAGIILCSERLKNFIKYKGNISIFSSGLDNETIFNIGNKLDIIKSMSNEREDLKNKSLYFRKNIKNNSSQSNIISIDFPDIELARDFFEENNIFPSVFAYPATPKNKPVLRFTLCNYHTYNDIDILIKFLLKYSLQIKNYVL
jgi:CAI-1 autoinducer synthase